LEDVDLDSFVEMLVEADSPVSFDNIDMDSQIEVPGELASEVPLDHV